MENDENESYVFGLKLQDALPENAIPVDCIVIVKYLDDDGEKPQVLVSSTETLSDFEALGLLDSCAELQRRFIQDNFKGADE